jgi:hypothetical protein
MQPNVMVCAIRVFLQIKGSYPHSEDAFRNLEREMPPAERSERRTPPMTSTSSVAYPDMGGQTAPVVRSRTVVKH